MKRFVLLILLLIIQQVIYSCDTTDFDTPTCSGEPDEEQLNKYICAECDGLKYLQVVCDNGHLNCPLEARGKDFYRVVAYDDWKNGKGDCIMAE